MHINIYIRSTSIYSHEYREIYLKRLPTVFKGVFFHTCHSLLVIPAWKYREDRRIGAIYAVKKPPFCQYLSPPQESNMLSLTRQVHRTLPQTFTPGSFFYGFLPLPG